MNTDGNQAAGHPLTPGLYGWDQLQTGDHYEIGEREVSADLVDRFAELSGDRFAIHLDDDAARELGFERRVAHGLLVLSMVDGLKNQCPVQLRAVASLGWDWTFKAPVLVGDCISGTVRIAEKRATSNPERGILTLEFKVTNGEGTLVQQGINTLMVQR